MTSHDHGRAWRSSLIASLLVVVLQTAFVFIDRTESPLRTWLRLGHAALSSIVIVVLVAHRRTKPERLARVLFVVNWLPLVPTFWLDEMERAATGMPWAPFVGPKLAVLGTGVLAPTPLWLGAALIVAMCVETVVLAHVHGLAGPREIVYGEPWVTLMYGVFALVLLVHRLRAQRIEAAMVRERAEREMISRLARVSLAVRDLASTPLQTLELDLALLRRMQPVASEQIERMTRALAQLRELRRVLAAHESAIGWHATDVSFDALERIAAGASTRGSPGTIDADADRTGSDGLGLGERLRRRRRLRPRRDDDGRNTGNR